MAITKTDTGKIVLSNAEYIHLTVWDSEDAVGKYTFSIKDIVGDTLNFTPEDNTINSIEGEFQDDPLHENIILGKYAFGADCIDFQSKILAAIFKWAKGTSGALYAPKGYKDIYATIEVGFRNEDVVVIAPKVKLNSKATLASLKTSAAMGNLAGTAYSAAVAYNGDTDMEESPIVIAPTKGDGADKYTVKIGNTSVAFTVGEGMDTAVEYPADATE